MKYHHRRPIAVLLASSVLVAIASTATTAAPRIPGDGAEGDDLSVEEMLAADYDMSLGEASGYLRWQSTFLELVHVAETEFPSSFAGARQATDNTMTGEISFVGAVPTRVQDLASRLGLEGSVVLTSAADLAAEDSALGAFEIASEISKTLGSDVGVSAAFDEESGTYIVEVSAPETSDELMRSDIAALDPDFDAMVDALEAELGFEIDIALVNAEPAETYATLNGGSALRTGSSSTASLGCTSGFNARNSAGVSFVSTAGHCSRSS